MNRVYCHPCKEWAINTGAKKCAWCDTPYGQTQKPTAPEKPPYQPAQSFLTPEQVKAAHNSHLEGLSVRAVARELWQANGYASEASCARALRVAFGHAGLKTRSKSEAQLGNANNRFCQKEAA